MTVDQDQVRFCFEGFRENCVCLTQTFSKEFPFPENKGVVSVHAQNIRRSEQARVRRLFIPIQ